jgi:dienelactone hydrolase
MANIVLFHSVLGLRHAERQVAARLRAAAHEVCVPDLFAGEQTDDLNEGFAIKDRIGWGTICDRARRAVECLPETVVLAGISMGAGVVAELWRSRPQTQGILLLHGLAELPATARSHTPVQLHVSAEDRFFPDAEVHAWSNKAKHARLSVEVFRYADAGHYFTDNSSPDYNEAAASILLGRVLAFLRRV